MFTVIDTETTGFDISSAKVLQFAYATFNEKFECVRSDSLYFWQDDFVIPPEASAVNGLTAANMAQYKPDYTKNLIKMFSVMNDNILVGYNSDRYDIPLIRSFLYHNMLPDIIIRPENQDAMLFALPLYKDASGRWKKLTVVSEKFGFTEDIIKQKAAEWFPNVQTRGAHDAVYDVTATALITLYCIDKGAVILNKDPDTAKTVPQDTIYDIDDLLNGTPSTENVVNSSVAMDPEIYRLYKCLEIGEPNVEGTIDGKPLLKKISDSLYFYINEGNLTCNYNKNDFCVIEDLVPVIKIWIQQEGNDVR